MGDRILMGILTLLIIFLSLGNSSRSIFEPQPVVEDNAPEAEKSQIMVLDFQAVVPLAKAFVNHELYVIFELTLLTEVDFQNESLDTGSYQSSYFSTLFERIISINAP